MFFKIITLWLLVCFATFWCSSNTKEDALIFDWKEEKLVETRQFDDKAVCKDCISACPPAVPGSIKKHLINDEVSITGSSIFVKNVYYSPITVGKMKIDICERPFSPSLVWDTVDESYAVGYEMYYEEESIRLKCRLYEDYIKVVNGKHDTDKEKDPPSEEIIKIHREGENTKFEVIDQPGRKMIFHWINVLFVLVFEEHNIRRVSITDDATNDHYFRAGTMSHCENYFSGDNETEDVSHRIPDMNETHNVPLQIHGEKRPAQGSYSGSGVSAKKQKTSAEQSENMVNRLVKTQIVPMVMFHTRAARLATCIYLNIAFVWEAVANNILNKIDLYLYALKRSFPTKMNLQFGVSGELQGMREEMPFEHHLFTKFTVPKIIYRFAKITVDKQLHGAVIIIHNSVEPVQDDDRICSIAEELGGWDSIKNENIIGLSYACAATQNVYRKLEFDETNFPKEMIPLQLNSFPNRMVIEYVSVLDKIDNTLEDIKKLTAINLD